MLTVLIVLIVSSCSLHCLVLADDVFASSAHLRLLADGEQRLVDAVNDYISAERRRLKQVEQLVLIYWLKLIYTELVCSYIGINIFLYNSGCGQKRTAT